jgi:hypothetical protein
VTVAALPPVRPSPPAPPLEEHILGPCRARREYWPGIPVIPSMANGYTDATFLGRSASRPTAFPVCGPIPIAAASTGSTSASMRSGKIGRDYMFDLIKAYTD